MKLLPVLLLCPLMANAAEVKISELPETNAPSASAVIPIVDAGANWKVQKANLLGTLTNWAKLSTNAVVWVESTNELVQLGLHVVPSFVAYTNGGIFNLSTVPTGSGGKTGSLFQNNVSGVQDAAFSWVFRTHDLGFTGNDHNGLVVRTDLDGSGVPDSLSVIYYGGGIYCLGSDVNFTSTGLGPSVAVMANNDGSHMTNFGFVAHTVAYTTNQFSVGVASSGQYFGAAGAAVGGYLEVDQGNSEHPVFENAALIVENKETGYPLIVGRTNNGTHVFVVDDTGLTTSTPGFSTPGAYILGTNTLTHDASTPQLPLWNGGAWPGVWTDDGSGNLQTLRSANRIFLSADGTGYIPSSWNPDSGAFNSDALTIDSTYTETTYSQSPSALAVFFRPGNPGNDETFGFTAPLYGQSFMSRTGLVTQLSISDSIAAGDSSVIGQASGHGDFTTGVYGTADSALGGTGFGVIGYANQRTSNSVGIAGLAHFLTPVHIGGIMIVGGSGYSCTNLISSVLQLDSGNTTTDLINGGGNGTNRFNVASTGKTTANAGFSSLATDAAVTIAATGWTNTFGKAAVVYINGTAATYTIADNAGTVVVTNSIVVGNTSTAILQTGGKLIVTAGSAISGRAVPW